LQLSPHIRKKGSVMTDVYKAPSASMDEGTTAYAGSGSLEDGIAGNYDFTIGGVIDEAWKRLSGNKGKIWLTFILYFIVAAVIAAIFNALGRLVGMAPDINPSFSAGNFGKSFILQSAENCITLPMMAGLLMMAIKLAVRASTDVTEIFRHYNKIVPIIIVNFLMLIMIAIGTCLLVLPGIYLAVSYYLAIPLIIEKDLGPWEAMEASRKAITHHWFKVFFLYLALVVILLISGLLLFIGLIWTLPMTLLVGGVLYRTIFGYSGEVSAAPDPVA